MPPLVPSTDALPLSAAMRVGSRSEHEDAEASLFVAELLEGRITKAGYAAYLRRLRVVYAALETVLRDRAGDPLVAAVHDPALDRLDALDADLDHWAPGEPHELPASASPAATAYRLRLESADWGGDLIAHHYTRYLGDLSGGRAIGRALERTFDADGAGTAFYDFPLVPRPKIYKDAYRARLDALDLPAADVARVVAEVKVAFRLNQDLFTELGDDIDAHRRPAL